jgi:nicotinate phosphoribosyltransferase
MSDDVMSVEGDAQAGEPLLAPVMQGGRRVGPSPTLADCRARAARDLARLPQALHRLEPGTAYPVEVAGALTGLAAEVDRRIAKTARSEES